MYSSGFSPSFWFEYILDILSILIDNRHCLIHVRLHIAMFIFILKMFSPKLWRDLRLCNGFCQTEFFLNVSQSLQIISLLSIFTGLWRNLLIYFIITGSKLIMYGPSKIEQIANGTGSKIPKKSSKMELKKIKLNFIREQ